MLSCALPLPANLIGHGVTRRTASRSRQGPARRLALTHDGQPHTPRRRGRGRARHRAHSPSTAASHHADSGRGGCSAAQSRSPSVTGPHFPAHAPAVRSGEGKAISRENLDGTGARTRPATMQEDDIDKKKGSASVRQQRAHWRRGSPRQAPARRLSLSRVMRQRVPGVPWEQKSLRSEPGPRRLLRGVRTRTSQFAMQRGVLGITARGCSDAWRVQACTCGTAPVLCGDP